jgi:uncharacterized protein YrrD
MQFEKGANVYTADDQKVGSIDRVVMDPRTKEVTHVVVRQGLLFREDKVVPVNWIDSAVGDGLKLGAAADLDNLPLFEEAHYIPLESDELDAVDDEANYTYWYPPVGVVPMGDYPYYAYPMEPYKVEVERNIPAGMVALKEGASVISADDQKVGTVERVFINDERRQATHLLIKDGWLFQTQKVVPVSWIDTVAEDEIHLAVDAPTLERVPPFEQNGLSSSTGRGRYENG